MIWKENGRLFSRAPDMGGGGATAILDNYLTDEQLAKSYRKSVRTIKRWRREGKAPPSFRHGNEELTHVDDAAAYLEAKREEARATNGAKRRTR